jgi:excisionase family DNA binding protein
MIYGHKMGTPVKFPTKKQTVKKAQGISSPTSHLKKRLYSIAETAEYLGRSVWSVRELIWNGKLPCVKVGRRIHLDILDLDQWIDRNKVKSFL